jgi:putative ABC transport system permease protein
MFKARAMRTFLTILGMSVGIGAILFLVSIGYGLQNALLERITTSDSLLTLDIAETKQSIVPLNKEALTKIKELEGVEKVVPSAQITTEGKFQDMVVDISVISTGPEYFQYGGVRLIQGDVFLDESPNKVVVTTALASILNQEESVLGKEIDFLFYLPKEEVSANQDDEFLVTAMESFESTEKYVISGIIESPESIAYIHEKSIEHLSIERYSGAKVKCESNGVMNSVRDVILEKGYIVSALSDTVDQANKIFQIIQLVLLSFGVIALVVSAIGMFNTMTIALLERTEEIGIMKSIGAFNKDVSILFIMESTIMGFLGGLGGVILGQLGGEIMNFLLNAVAVRFGGQVVDVFYSPTWFVTMIILVGAVVGFFTGFFPARRASKIDPLDALRYK